MVRSTFFKGLILLAFNWGISFSPSVFAQEPISKGLAKHDFFYAGESKIHRMYMVKEGKIVWKYINTGSRGEISDAMLLSDGNVLFAHQYGITEITHDQKVVWSIEAHPQTEIHTVQPIGKNHVVYVQNGIPAKVIIMEIPGKKIIREFVIPTAEPPSVHGQFRNARLTAKGTLLVAHMSQGKVCEYDNQGNVLFVLEVASPWSVSELKNGHILVTSNRGFVREVSRKGETVWEIKLTENPAYKVSSPQVSYRLPNGNTIINNWFNEWNSAVTLDRKNPPLQAIEVTPDNKVVWELNSWNDPNDLGPSTIIQPLDEPVVRENLFFGDIK